MVHPELDQAFGRLAAARLRTAPAVVGEPCPDAEVWAAYADGGLRPDEVAGLDAHLSGCVSCRRLVAALLAEVAAAAPATVSSAETIEERRGVVLPFRPRLTGAWLSIAAAVLAAVTLWTVARFDGAAPVTTTADGRTAGAPPASAPVAATAPPATVEETRPDAAPVGGSTRPAAPTTPAKEAVGDRLARLDDRRDKAAERPPSRAAGGAAANEPRDAAAPPSGAGQAATPAPARQIALQTNTVPATARPHGPLANQQSNLNQQVNAPPVGSAPAALPTLAAAAPPPAPKPAAPAEAPAQAAAGAPAAAAPTPARDEARRAGRERAAQADVAKADTAKTEGAKDSKDAEAKRAAPAAVSEIVSTTGAVGGRREADAGRAFSAGALRAAAPIGFAEPEGRLRWQIVGERRLESSSDGGTTWTVRFPRATERLRAGSAPSIESAWAVGEGGLVLRLAVPGTWTAVSRPGSATLVAVEATSADAARVTTDDGRVFVTNDGGQSWTPAPVRPQ